MTIAAKELAALIHRHVTFVPSTGAKTFVTRVAAKPDMNISPRGEAWLWRIAYNYRRQLPKDLAEEAVRRRILHTWQVVDEATGKIKCSVCEMESFLRSRERNAPCLGTAWPPRRRPRICAREGCGKKTNQRMSGGVLRFEKFCSNDCRIANRQAELTEMWGPV